MENIKDFLKVGKPRGIRRQLARGSFDAHNGADGDDGAEHDSNVRSVQDIEVVLNNMERTAEYIKDLRNSVEASSQQSRSPRLVISHVWMACHTRLVNFWEICSVACEN